MANYTFAPGSLSGRGILNQKQVEFFKIAPTLRTGIKHRLEPFGGEGGLVAYLLQHASQLTPVTLGRIRFLVMLQLSPGSSEDRNAVLHRFSCKAT